MEFQDCLICKEQSNKDELAYYPEFYCCKSM